MKARLDAAWIFAVCAALFLYTRTPRLTFFDNAEYVTCAAVLGVNHSPGYPLYTWIGKLASLLPLLPGDTADRVNEMNALAGALGVGLFAWALQAWGVTRVAAIVGALAFGVSRTYWAYCGHAKVYTFNIVLLDAALLLLAAWHRTGRQAFLIWCGAAVGLLLGNHTSMWFALPAAFLGHVLKGATKVFPSPGGRGTKGEGAVALAVLTVLFLLAAAKARGAAGAILGAVSVGTAWLSLRKLPRVPPWTAQSVGLAAGAAIVAFTVPYLWMMFRAGRFPAMDFWVPDNPVRLLDTIRMRSYDYMTTGTSWSQVWRQWSIYGTHFAHQWHPLLWPLGFVAIGILVYTRNWAILGLGLCGFLVTSFGQLAVLNLSRYGPIMFAEVELWIIPSVFFFCILFAAGLSEFFRMISVARVRRGIAAASFLVPAVALAHNRFYCDWSKNYLPYDYARNILASLPPRALLLTHFEDTFLIWELQYVEGVRRDAPVIVADLLGYDWYWKRLLPHLHPDLHLPEDKLPDAENAEDSAAIVQQRREEALLAANGDRPLYTDNIELSRTGARHLLIPEGTVWRIAADPSDLFHPLVKAVENLTSYSYRGILSSADSPLPPGEGQGEGAPPARATLFHEDAATRARDATEGLSPLPSSDPDAPVREGWRLYRIYENAPVLLDFRLDVYCQYVLNGYAREANFTGVLFDTMGDRSRAARLWKLAHDLAPLDPNPIQNLKAAEEANPKKASEPFLTAGLQYMEMGLSRNAETLWRRSAETEPSAAAKAWSNLATLALQQERFADARDALAHALRLDPTNDRLRQMQASLAGTP